MRPASLGLALVDEDSGENHLLTCHIPQERAASFVRVGANLCASLSRLGAQQDLGRPARGPGAWLSRQGWYFMENHPRQCWCWKCWCGEHLDRTCFSGCFHLTVGREACFSGQRVLSMDQSARPTGEGPVLCSAACRPLMLSWGRTATGNCSSRSGWCSGAVPVGACIPAWCAGLRAAHFHRGLQPQTGGNLIFLRHQGL